jgi:hypothetical protein
MMTQGYVGWCFYFDDAGCNDEEVGEWLDSFHYLGVG